MAGLEQGLRRVLACASLFVGLLALSWGQGAGATESWSERSLQQFGPDASAAFNSSLANATMQNGNLQIATNLGRAIFDR